MLSSAEPRNSSRVLNFDVDAKGKIQSRQAITNPETLDHLEDDQFDASREAPTEDCLCGEIPDEDLRWAAAQGLHQAIRTREGATFIRLADDVFLIPVIGGQPLHHDRHLRDVKESRGFSEHCWNLVVSGSDEQMLLCEVDDRYYEHFALTQGALIYMNTVNNHAISRKSAAATVVILQVDGYGPHQREAAVARMCEVLAMRPPPKLVGGNWQ